MEAKEKVQQRSYTDQNEEEKREAKPAKILQYFPLKPTLQSCSRIVKLQCI